MIVIGLDGCVFDEALPDLNARQPEHLLVGLRAVCDGDRVAACGEPACLGRRA